MPINKASSQANIDDDNFYVGTVKTESADTQQPQPPTVLTLDEWTTSLEVNGKKQNVKLDTGAKCNIVSKQILDEIGAMHLLRK